MSLKSEREKAGLSQSELARKSGVDVRKIQGYEQGLRNINRAAVETVLDLAEALDVSIYKIINR